MSLKRKLFVSIRFLDVLGISFAWVLAYLIRWSLTSTIDNPINPFEGYIRILPVILLIWMIVIHSISFNKVEDVDVDDSVTHFVNVFKSVLMGMFITMSFSFMAKEYDFGRSVVIFFTLLVMVYLIITRQMIIRRVQSWHDEGLFKQRTIILGAGELGVRVLQKIEDFSKNKYEVIGFVDDLAKKGELVCDRPVLGHSRMMAEIIEAHQIKHVFISNSAYDNEKLFEMVEQFEGKQITFSLLSNIFEMLKNNKAVHVVGSLPLIDVQYFVENPFYRTVQKIFDVVFSFLILLFFLPFGILIAIAIKLDSPGPIFIRQKRIGLNGVPFNMLKFRSMYRDIDLYEKAPNRQHDPRVTRVGKIIRNLSLDEFPQFMNVLKNEMSVIGPRPEMGFIVEKYLPWQRKRLSIKPGITGLWQVLGRKNIPLEGNLEYDFYYLKNRSFALDISILLKTIPAVFFRKGAF